MSTEPSHTFDHLTEMQRQLRQEIQHLQDLRAKLISTYFLILGGSGYLAHLVLSALPHGMQTAVSSPVLWITALLLVLLLVALAFSFGARTAQYTDVIRTDLNRVYIIDDYIIAERQVPFQLPLYRESSYSANWRRFPLGWPVGLLIFPLISSCVVFLYMLTLCTYFWQTGILLACIVALIAATLIACLNAFALNLLRSTAVPSAPAARTETQ